MKSGGVVFQRNWSVVQHCIVSLHPDLHNYRAWSETVEFFGKKKKIIPDFFTLFLNHFYPLIIKFVSTRCSSSFFSQGEKSGGRKNCIKRVAINFKDRA